jgi:Tol biopolymer transport system component
VSPDGSRFAVVGVVDGLRGLYQRGAGDESFRLMPETEGAREPSFSPEGDWIAYATGTAVWRVSVAGGAPRPVISESGLNPRDTHWGDDGSIIFSGGTGLHRVPDTGGEPVPLLGAVRGFFNPSLLPGGWAVIGTVNGNVVLLDLETDSIRQLIPDAFDPKFSESGHLLYADGTGGLWAAPFDTERGEVVGASVPIFDGLSILGEFGASFARYSVSRNGTLVYGAGASGGGGVGEVRLLVVDLGGDAEEPPLAPRNFVHHRWSPDGTSIAYASLEAGDDNPNIYTYDVALGTTPRQLTFEGINFRPVWSPDGTRVAFASARDGSDGFDLFVKNVNDGTPPTAIIHLPGDLAPTDWPSEDVIVFERGVPRPTFGR